MAIVAGSPAVRIVPAQRDHVSEYDFNRGGALVRWKGCDVEYPPLGPCV